MKPKDGYIFYIMNPKCGCSSAKPLGQLFRRYLVNRGYDVRLNWTDSLSHVNDLATEAAVDYDCGVVVVGGGDGTVREAAKGLEGSDKPMLIVPLGTENLFASELGFDTSLKTLRKTFENFYCRRVDLGRINAGLFTSIIGLGFDGEVVDRVQHKRKGHINHLDYFGPIWRTFCSYKYWPMTVSVDGEEIFDGQGLVFVGNISRYALGLNILQKADCTDGLLDVCIYKCHSKLGLIQLSLTTIINQHGFSKNVIYRQGKKININSPLKQLKTEVDGDPGPALPAEIEVVPEAVNCIIPEGVRPAGLILRIARTLS